ncbi:MAG: ATP-binding cassette domain-containing protein [Actinophytocola sp.]|nr:ATP-binding cassette domain-containing protein [Actinophytocola sp.]
MLEHSAPSISPAGANGTSSALRTEDLAIEFVSGDRRVLAVDSLNVNIQEGEFVCIVGPSGCGKSTLLNAAAGILLDDQKQGVNVDITGTLELAAGSNRHDGSIGYVFQSDTVLPWLSVERNVGLPLKFAGVRDWKPRAQSWLARLGLSDFADAYPRTLSGGMRKRVQVAQVFAQNPRLMLMDEPFGSLDAQTRAVVQEEFVRIWETESKTVLFVTHDLTEAILLADRILCMCARPGKIVREFIVDIPRPRTVKGVADHPSFSKLYSELWSVLEEEARMTAAMGNKA